MFRASSGSVWVYTALNDAHSRDVVSSNLAKDLYVNNVCPSFGILTSFFYHVAADGIMVADANYRYTDFMDV